MQPPLSHLPHSPRAAALISCISLIYFSDDNCAVQLLKWWINDGCGRSKAVISEPFAQWEVLEYLVMPEYRSPTVQHMGEYPVSAGPAVMLAGHRYVTLLPHMSNCPYPPCFSIPSRGSVQGHRHSLQCLWSSCMLEIKARLIHEILARYSTY